MVNLVQMDIMDHVQSQETRYTNWYNSNELTVQFQPHHLRHRAMESVTSGEYSWPQWGNNSPSPPKSPSHPLLGQSPSSDSRARAIARGQWELMEMVKNMPESSYELSLKDMVEKNQETRDDRGPPLDKNDQDLHRTAVVKSNRSREESKKFVNRSSFEKKGLFLNMGFPFPFPFPVGSRKKKKGKVGRNCSNSKVSPKVDGTGEKDWWKKRFTGSSDSSSSSGGTTSTTVSSRGWTSSSGGGSGNGCGSRKRNWMPTICCPFFHSDGHGRKSVE